MAGAEFRQNGLALEAQGSQPEASVFARREGATLCPVVSELEQRRHHNASDVACHGSDRARPSGRAVSPDAHRPRIHLVSAPRRHGLVGVVAPRDPAEPFPGDPRRLFRQLGAVEPLAPGGAELL